MQASRSDTHTQTHTHTHKHTHSLSHTHTNTLTHIQRTHKHTQNTYTNTHTHSHSHPHTHSHSHTHTHTLTLSHTRTLATTAQNIKLSKLSTSSGKLILYITVCYYVKRSSYWAEHRHIIITIIAHSGFITDFCFTWRVWRHCQFSPSRLMCRSISWLIYAPPAPNPTPHPTPGCS